MEYAEYISAALKTLSSLEEEYEFSTRSVLKNNDTMFDALMARIPGRNLVPTLYFQDLYEEFQSRYTADPELLPIQCQRILDRISPANTPIPDSYHLIFSDFEQLKDRIVFRVVGRQNNHQLLADVPHRDFLDLSIVYYILLDTGNTSGQSAATALIHNGNMECWNTTEEELYLLAEENTPKLLPPQIQDIESLIEEIFGVRLHSDRDETDENHMQQIIREASKTCPMYVLSNPTRLYGAAAILYPGLLEEFRAHLGCGFFVLPSSVHETILVPFQEGIEPTPSQIDNLKNMVRQVNEENVSPTERLSDSVYLYDLPEKGLCL